MLSRMRNASRLRLRYDAVYCSISVQLFSRVFELFASSASVKILFHNMSAEYPDSSLSATQYDPSLWLSLIL